ncbi:MAG: cytochrome P450 [Bacteriovoracaceae bacterium]
MKEQSDSVYSRGLPVIGHLLDYQKDRLKLLTDLRQKHGSRFRLKIGPKTLAVLTDPADIKRVMHTNISNYYKKTNFDQLFGIGVFTSNDEAWKIQRKMVQPLFGPRYIESCAAIILNKTKENLKAYIEKSQDTEADIYDYYAKATFDIIIATIIGIDYSSRFKELNFALNYVSDYLTRSNYLPFELPRWASPSKKKYRECQNLLDEIIFESVEAQKSQDKRKDSSMISLLLEAQEKNPGIEFSDQRIRDNIITLMFAGFETSALTLSWLSCLLAAHPQTQEELYQEIKGLSLDSIKVKDFDNYPVLDAVVNETMRLYPAGWAWTRMAREDDDINGFSVKKNDIILLSPYLTQRDPLIWENPNEFQHKRFMNVEPGKYPPFSFFPFGGGPRICVGKQFGTVEIKMILVWTLQNYKLVGNKVPSPAPLATLQAREGFNLQLKRRQ